MSVDTSIVNFDFLTEHERRELENTTSRTQGGEQHTERHNRNPGVSVFTPEGRPRKEVDILLDIGKQHHLFPRSFSHGVRADPD